MQNWLEGMDPMLLLKLDRKVKIIYILLNEFFQEHQSLQQNQKEELVLNMIDEEINRSVAYFNTFFGLLLKKLNVKPQSILDTKSVQYPACLKEEELENCPIVSNSISDPKINKRKFISRNKHRGPYRSYTRDQKNYVVFLHGTGMNFATISKQLGIPQKNVVRWCREGIMEEDSNKRLADSDMEKALWLWIQTHPRKQKLSFNDIRTKALKLSSNPHFKASRGWMKNFLKRCDSTEKLVVLEKQSIEN